MTGQPFHIESLDDLARAIVLAEAQGSHGFAHLARALAAGRIAFQPLMSDTSASRFKAFARLTRDRPAVISIGDDDELDRGPAGWPLAARSIAWARAIMLHAAGGEIQHYEAAIVAAELVDRCLIIECGTVTLEAWATLVRGAPHKPQTLVITPREGVHPIPTARETVH